MEKFMQNLYEILSIEKWRCIDPEDLLPGAEHHEELLNAFKKAQIKSEREEIEIQK